jgi:hypothetical protein
MFTKTKQLCFITMVNQYLIYDASTSSVWDYCNDRITALPSLKYNNRYFSVYKAFCTWIDDKIVHSPIVDETDIVLVPDVDFINSRVNKYGTVFTTQNNVDVYFSTVLVHISSMSAAVMRMKVSALTWFLRNVEQPGADPIAFSDRITTAMHDQQIDHVEYTSTAFASSDPHKGLKDLFSERQTVLLVNGMWKRNDSDHLMFAYSWGRNAGVRGDTTRKVVFCDLNLSNGFGPETSPPRDCTLLMILRKGLTKDKHNTTQQVGVQRHCDYLRCTVFATAVLVIMRLRELGDQINFYKGAPGKACDWWHIPISDYSTYSTECNAMKQVLANTGSLDRYSTKVTHHRAACVQYGGSQGLTAEQLSTITKHKLDKLNSAYMPEVEEETLKVMSGFRKWETRYVKTEHVVFPRERSVYLKAGTKHLLPGYHRYLKEHRSTRGDHSTCAEKFLLHILPYFVETIMQCGYWFINDFPLHPLTQILRVSNVLFILHSLCYVIIINYII